MTQTRGAGRRQMVAKSDRWLTPPEVLECVRELGDGSIALDPCTEPDNPVGARRHFAIAQDQDGLKRSWRSTGIVWCNPPFSKRKGDDRSQIYAWLEKALHEAKRGASIVFLASCSNRFETPTFQRALVSEQLAAVAFWRGRIRFIDQATRAQKGAGFQPSMLLFLGPHHPEQIVRAFGARAAVVPVARHIPRPMPEAARKRKLCPSL